MNVTEISFPPFKRCNSDCRLAGLGVASRLASLFHLTLPILAY
jgi:hypothetical protein